MFPMKRFSRVALMLVAASFLASGCGDPYPSKTIDGTIAWGAGGGTDGVSRMLTPMAAKTLGVSINLTNRTGKTGSVGLQHVQDRAADGYSVVYHAENPPLYQILGISDLNYDQFEPILLAVQGSTVIVVPRSSPYKTYADLMNAAKAEPGKVSIGISGVGGQPYVTSIILKKVEGVSFKQVAFEGDGPLVTALLAKQLDVSCLAVGAAAQHVNTGNLRALAIMSPSPNPSMPGVPPITELNPAYKEVMKASGFFYGVWVKKDTPQAIIDKLKDAYKTAYNDPMFKEYAALNGFTLMGISGQEAKDFLKVWQSQMAWLIYEAGGAKESPEKFGIPKPAAK